MTRILQALFLAGGLLASSPALAQSRGYYRRPPPYAPPPRNALRLEIGGASLSSRYCPDGYAGTCFSSDPWGALLVSGDLDLALGRGPIYLTVGARYLAAQYYEGDPSIFEPAVGITFKFIPYAPVSPRLNAGLGVLIGNNGDAGASFRLGGGLSFLGASPIGFAVDLMFDFGRLGGVGISQVQLAIGPEFHF